MLLFTIELPPLARKQSEGIGLGCRVSHSTANGVGADGAYFCVTIEVVNVAAGWLACCITDPDVELSRQNGVPTENWLDTMPSSNRTKMIPSHN